MEVKELINLFANSSQRASEAQYIPWWEGNHEDAIYRYSVFKKEVVQEIEACVAECEKETLLTTGGYYGLTLFHFLVWHNFYDAVEKMLCDG